MAAAAIVNRPVALDLAGVLPDPASREPLQRWVVRRAVSDLMDLPGDNTGFNRVTNAIGEVTNHLAYADAWIATVVYVLVHYRFFATHVAFSPVSHHGSWY